MVVYTSGTTGHPKGILITHGMLRAITLSYLTDVNDVFSQVISIYAAHMSHGAGLYSLMNVLKGAWYVYPRVSEFDPLEIFYLAENFGLAHMFTASTIVKGLGLLAASSLSHTLKGFRTIVYGGGPRYMADLVDAVEIFGDIFVQIYGQEKCPMAISVLNRQDVSDRGHPRWRERLASIGRAQSVVEEQIGDSTVYPLAFAQTGEVKCAGSPSCTDTGTNRKPTKTFINGWFMTGDMGVVHETGHIKLKYLSKDLIISGGSNIYPREDEELPLAHPDWGEEVVAFFVAKAGCGILGEMLDIHRKNHTA